MDARTTLRLLPWLSPDGKPCFLANGSEGGYVSRLADETEDLQLAEGSEVLVAARRVLGDPLSPNVEVRYAAIRLSECLADVLRVAESRGRRLPTSDTDDTDEPCDPHDDAEDNEDVPGHEIGNGSDHAPGAGP
ncbi:hypothetical protein [Streptomyces kebangsaanensis]|uniref:hypothetical protein n=1 Tax=Streptomyces kebangsaanensis TaxID=864058 RepID=UPI000B23DCCE|nr:hypothetical protein [Streptomyces kebangsaanensis]